jgi:hypothetical protein
LFRRYLTPGFPKEVVAFFHATLKPLLWPKEMWADIEDAELLLCLKATLNYEHTN